MNQTFVFESGKASPITDKKVRRHIAQRSIVMRGRCGTSCLVPISDQLAQGHPVPCPNLSQVGLCFYLAGNGCSGWFEAALSEEEQQMYWHTVKNYSLRQFKTSQEAVSAKIYIYMKQRMTTERLAEFRYLGVLGDIQPEVLNLRASAQDLEIEHQRLRLGNANTQNNVSLLLEGSSAAPQASGAPLMLGGSSAAPHASVAPLMLGGSSAVPQASIVGCIIEHPDSSCDELKEEDNDDDGDPMDVDFDSHIQEAEATLRDRDSSASHSDFFTHQ